MQFILSDLFRKTEADLGTHEFCILVLEALKNALLQYCIKADHDFVQQFMKIFDLVKGTSPRYAILIDSFYRFLEYYEIEGKNQSTEELIKEIERIKISYKLETKKLIDIAQSIDIEGKNILIHDHSHSVQRTLEFFAQKHKKFQIIIAEQDMEKTEDNIVFFHKLGVPYKVVPSYMLSHIDETIDMVFAGGVTFQADHQFVMDPGSKSIISHFFLEKKPVYVFLTTSKFSLWPIAGRQSTIYSKQHRRKHHILQEIEFERLKFSHDRVPLNLISHVVTEKGIYEPKELVEMFDDMFKKRAEKQEKYKK